jgi:hypothetical protein
MIKKITDFNSSDEYLNWYKQHKIDFSSVGEKNCYLAAMTHTKEFVRNMGDEFCGSLYKNLIEYGNIEDFLKELQHEYLKRHDMIL